MIKIIKSAFSQKVFRHGILFSVFSFFNSGINFLLLLILARYILPSEYGELNLFTTLLSLLSILISLNTTGILSVEYFNRTRIEIQALITCIIYISSFVLLLCSLLILSGCFDSAIGISSEYQFIAILICYAQVFTTINLDLWRLKERPVTYGIYSMLLVLFNFGITLMLIITFHYGWTGRVYAQLVVGIIFSLFSLLFLIHNKYFKILSIPKSIIINALSFGLPLIPHNASIWIRQGIDRYIINYYYTTLQVGYFSFAYNIANIIHIIGFAFNATNSVHIYKNLAKNNENTSRMLFKMTKIMMTFFFILTIFICILSVILIPLVFPKYVDAIKYILPLSIASMFQCIYYLFVNYIFYYKKTKELMYITFGFSLIHLVLSLLITKISISYTAYITMVVNIGITLAIVQYSNRIYPLFKLNKSN